MSRNTINTYFDLQDDDATNGVEATNDTAVSERGIKGNPVSFLFRDFLSGMIFYVANKKSAHVDIYYN